MKYFLLIQFLLLVQLSFGQTNSERQHRKATNSDGSSAVTLLKVSSSILVSDSDIVGNSGLAYELNLTKRLAYGGYIGCLHLPIPYTQNRNLIGLSLDQNLKVYFVPSRAYLGFTLSHNRLQSVDDFEFYLKGSAGGWGGHSYSTTAKYTNNSWNGYLTVGFQPSIFSSKFNLEWFLGFGASVSTRSFKGLTDKEVYLLDIGYGESNGTYQTLGTSFVFPSFCAGMSFGFNTVKKNSRD
jgi:hypothetical protein